MKKLLLPLLLLLAFGMLLAVESAPSAVVGYVKYEMIAGNNVVAIPMDAGLSMASNIAMSYSGTCDAVSYFGTDETWYAAYSVEGDWYDDFPVAPGATVMMYAYDTTPFYSIGALPATSAVYDLIAGNAIISVPLNRSDLTSASLLGNSIVGSNGTCDAVSYFGADENWYAAYSVEGDWYDDFPITIGTPVMVYSYDTMTWPNRSLTSKQNKRSSK